MLTGSRMDADEVPMLSALLWKVCQECMPSARSLKQTCFGLFARTLCTDSIGEVGVKK